MGRKANTNNNKENVEAVDNTKSKKTKVEDIEKNSTMSTDFNNIEEAASDAINDINSVLYADNIVAPKNSSKTIRSLDIKDSKENNLNKEKNTTTNKNKTKKATQNNKESTSDNVEIDKKDVKKENIENTNTDKNENENIDNNKTVIEDTNINKENLNNYEVVKEKKSKKKFIIITLICLFICLLIFILSTIFALINSSNTTIISGTYISGINVSGLSKEDAKQKVSTIISEKLNTEIILKHNDYKTSVFAEQFQVYFDIEYAIEIAYSRGRTGNIFQNNYDILSALLFKTNIGPSFSYSEETLNSLITEMETALPDKLIEPSYYVEDSNLIITKGIDGVVISSTDLKNKIIYFINNFNVDSNVIEIPVEQKIASAIDIDKIHLEIYKKPQDAYYSTDPYVIHPHINGIDFAITIDQIKEMLKQNQETYTVPLEISTPNITTNQIGTEAFPDLLGNFSTTYSTKNSNRSTNIRLASEKINGTVIMPEEVFSYNQTVGKRTAAAGFKAAAVYSNGEVTTGIGGGICQVSTTLYNAVLLSNLEIVERYNHGFQPGYVKSGTDATVSWGGPDFKFKNNRDYPIKIVCSGSGGKIVIQIFGLYTDPEYEVVIQAYVTQSIPYKTITKKDASLAKGETKVIQSGSNGCKTETYKILKLNGEIVSKDLLSRDTYNPHNKIISVGTR